MGSAKRRGGHASVFAKNRGILALTKCSHFKYERKKGNTVQEEKKGRWEVAGGGGEGSKPSYS